LSYYQKRSIFLYVLFLVTGGSGDLGKAICIDLAKSNIEVLVHSNTNKTKAIEIVKTIDATLDNAWRYSVNCNSPG
jgi:3-oxoacyl-[acyl-carrier protein] reductase